MLFSDGDVTLVELSVLTTGLVLGGDLARFATLLSTDFVRVGVAVVFCVGSVSFFLLMNEKTEEMKTCQMLWKLIEGLGRNL